MDSFLKRVEENYDLFKYCEGEIPEFYHFPEDIIEAFYVIFCESNQYYLTRCKALDKPARGYSSMRILKDQSGKCYLKVVANDNHTTIILRQDDSKYEDYKIVGRKMTESEFKNLLNMVELRRFFEAKLSPRFIKDVIPMINLEKEMTTEEFLDYHRYLYEEFLESKKAAIDTFDEPDNPGSAYYRQGGTSPDRKNDVIDFELRERALMEKDPIMFYKIVGSQTGIELMAYVYEKGEYCLVVVEPVSGLGYQYCLNLGPMKYLDEEQIKSMVKEALQATEEVVLMDDAIMRKSHTTIETFKENLDIFLSNAKSMRPFYGSVQKAKDVYKRC